MRALLGNLTDTDIRLLRIFMAVVEAGGLSAAELELNIGRSTISRHLKDLELRLGMTLCRRGRAGFSMTQEGVQIYEYAQRLITSIEEFRHQVNDMHHNLQGQLAIAMFDKTVTNPDCHVAQAIATFLTQAPQVQIDIHVVPVNQIEKGVLDGRYQVGIIPTHRSSSSLKYLPLFNEQMHLYCGRGHPLFARAHEVADAEIRAQPYAGLSFHSPNMESGRRHELNKSSVANDQEGIATLIRSGVFIGYLPDHYAESFVNRDEMRRLAGESFDYCCEFAALYRKSPSPTRLLQTFLAALEQHHAEPQQPPSSQTSPS